MKNEKEKKTLLAFIVLHFFRCSLSLLLFIFNQRRRYTHTRTLLTHTLARGMCINVKFNRFRPIDMFQCEFWFVCYSFELFFPSWHARRRKRYCSDIHAHTHAHAHLKNSFHKNLSCISHSLWLCYGQINNGEMYFDTFLLVEIYVCTHFSCRLFSSADTFCRFSSPNSIYKSEIQSKDNGFKTIPTNISLAKNLNGLINAYVRRSRKKSILFTFIQTLKRK